MPYHVRRERSAPRRRFGVPRRTAPLGNRSGTHASTVLQELRECSLPRLPPHAAQIARSADKVFLSLRLQPPRNLRAPTLLHVQPQTGPVRRSALHVYLSPVAKSWSADSAPSLPSTPGFLLGLLHR